MKTIVYSSNSFQALLCIRAVEEYMEGDRPATQEAFGGKIHITRNMRSVKVEYVNWNDTAINFTGIIKEKDKSQLEILYNKTLVKKELDLDEEFDSKFINNKL